MPPAMAEPADAVRAFEALLAPEGQELLHRLRHEDDPADLRLGTELRARYPVELVTAALAQHELRLRARAKFSRALDMYFTRPGLEQASAEVIAGHRKARYAGAALVADLCCGIERRHRIRRFSHGWRPRWSRSCALASPREPYFSSAPVACRAARFGEILPRRC